MGIFRAISREYLFFDRVVGAVRAVGKATADRSRTVADLFEDACDRHGVRPAVIFEGKALSYAAFDAAANRMAHWALAQGLQAGDRVALFMTNRPHFLITWYGLSKIGVVTALINNQLTGRSLAHCVSLAEAKALITETSLLPPAHTAKPHIEDFPTVWSLGGGEGAHDLSVALSNASSERPGRAHRASQSLLDTVLMIYTSGTTGMPKAAKMTHAKVTGLAYAFSTVPRITSRDRVFIPLPLYHATGGVCGVSSTFAAGAALVIERRFSTSRFWDSVTDTGATVFYYVGELCRFLASAPAHPKERAHALRAVVGNGLRPDVWPAFQSRFGVKGVYEFYGSTEGNVALMNADGQMGAVGRVPPYARNKFNVRVVRFDTETETPIRGPDGRCIECGPGEVGEVIGKVEENVDRHRFEGYQGQPEQTAKKILTDAFEEGDRWFRTGDLMRFDKDGYYYFVDRVGDTFRWRSENVATTEVAEALTGYPGVAQANVYGVEIPGYDGRAGMAAIVADGEVDLAALRAHLADSLPPYARPVFLRVHADAQRDTTGTLKFTKVNLVREGFDPDAIADPVYFDDPRASGYVPLDRSVYEEIVHGRVRV